MIELNELQLSLLLIGIIIIFGVWLFNQIQFNYIRRKKSKLISTSFLSQRQEPTLHNQEDTSVVDVVQPHLTNPDAYILYENNPIDIAYQGKPKILPAETTLHQPYDIKNNIEIAENNISHINRTPVETQVNSVDIRRSENEHVIHSDLENNTVVKDSIHPVILQHDIHKDSENWQQQISSAFNSVIDQTIDCVIDLPLKHAVSSERILPLLKHLRYVGNKPIYCEGLNLTLKIREPIRMGQGYSNLSIATQLANRNGAISALDFSEFVGGVQKLAQHLGSLIDLPDMASVLSRAQKLDAFAQQNDMQIYLHIENLQQPWLASHIKKSVEHDGLLLARDGYHFHYCHHKDISVPLFSLRFGEANFLHDDLSKITGHKITFCFDAPYLKQGMQSFRIMWSYIKHLADILSGEITDDLGKPLSDKACQLIERHLCELYARLSRQGVPAGSSSALRLFNT